MARALFVVGMHRSGTSALTGVLQLLGVELGRQLLPARAGVNDKGFFEQERIFRIHNALLEALGSAWDDVAPLQDGWWNDARVQPFRAQLTEFVREEFATSPLWGLKDPRLCKTLPLWREILAQEGIELCPILIGRAPDEVGESLRKVHGIDPQKARALWLRHVLDGERLTRGGPRVIVTYDQLLTSWRDAIARIGQEFTLTWPRTPDAAANEVRAFLDPQLKRSQAPEERDAETERGGALPSEAAWRRFVRAAAGEAVGLATALDDAARPFDAMLRDAHVLVADLHDKRAELRDQRAELGRRSAALSEVKALAAARDVDLASVRAELAQFRSQLPGGVAEVPRLRGELKWLQATLAAARASIRRRRMLLRRMRRSPAWRLLNLWRALARRMRRRSRV